LGAFEIRYSKLVRVRGIPTSSDVLQWARDFRRLSEEDAATKLGVTVDIFVRSNAAVNAKPNDVGSQRSVSCRNRRYFDGRVQKARRTG
jgi:hypothetical protein